jgi:hypothetical protein
MILEKNMPEKTVKVRVSDRWRVVHDDKPYVKGDTLTVPENVAQNGSDPAGLNGSPANDEPRES